MKVSGPERVNIFICAVVIFCTAAVAVSDGQAGEEYYYAGGKRIAVERSPGRFVVRFAQDTSESSISAAASAHNLREISWPGGLNQPDEWRIFELSEQASPVAHERVRAAFERRGDVETTAPAYRMKKGGMPV